MLNWPVKLEERQDIWLKFSWYARVACVVIATEKLWRLTQPFLRIHLMMCVIKPVHKVFFHLLRVWSLSWCCETHGPPMKLRENCAQLLVASSQLVWAICRGSNESCNSYTSCHCNRISSFLAPWILFCSSQRGAEPSKEGGEQWVLVPPCENQVQESSPPQQGLSFRSWWMKKDWGDMFCLGEMIRRKALHSRRQFRAVTSEDSRAFLKFKIGCW